MFGFVSLSGAADLAVTIRTAVVTPRNVTVGCGGAIVADSEPAAEWRETMLKARAVADSLGAHIRGADDAAAERARPAPHIAADDDDTDFGVQNATLMEVAH